MRALMLSSRALIPRHQFSELADQATQAAGVVMGATLIRLSLQL